VKGALSLHAAELLIGAVFVQGAPGARVVSMHAGVNMVRAEEYIFAMTDFQFGKIQAVDKCYGHGGFYD